MAEPAWMKQAACRRYPAEWWYLDKDREMGNEKALLICRTGCPVLRECFEYAIDLIGDKGGRNDRPLGVIWAGIKWRLPKFKLDRVPEFRICIGCEEEIPPWARRNQTRCAECIRQGVRA
jgi:hypothetical protein